MRRPTEHSLTLSPRAPGVTLQQWLYAALCEAMRDGTLQPGSRLPTTRSLARDHGVSRSTVTAVFEQLLADGYISARVGRGSFVAPGLARQAAELKQTIEQQQMSALAAEKMFRDAQQALNQSRDDLRKVTALQWSTFIAYRNAERAAILSEFSFSNFLCSRRVPA